MSNSSGHAPNCERLRPPSFLRKQLGARPRYHDQTAVGPSGRGEAWLQFQEAQASEPWLPHPLGGFDASGPGCRRGPWRRAPIQTQRPEFVGAHRWIAARPLARALRGHSGFGNEGVLREAEAPEIADLFELRLTKNVKRMIGKLSCGRVWVYAGQGFEARPSAVRLEGWRRQRRAVVRWTPQPCRATARAARRLRKLSAHLPADVFSRHKYNPIPITLKMWLGRLDSNQGMAESKSAALPLGYAPKARVGFAGRKARGP